MTPKEMRELDAWLAENVMGWAYDELGGLIGEIKPAYITEDNSYLPAHSWQPTTNIIQAIKCLEEYGKPYVLKKLGKGSYTCQIILELRKRCLREMETLCLAISLALKKAWETK